MELSNWAIGYLLCNIYKFGWFDSFFAFEKLLKSNL